MTAIPKKDDFVFIEWKGDVNGTDNPRTVTMNGDMSIIAVFKDMSELIVNGAVENGTDDWGLYINPDYAEASADVINGEYSLTIEKNGTESWHIQLSQTKIHLLKNREYTLPFSARANTSSTLR